MTGQAYMSIHGNFCYNGLLRGSVVPAKFLAQHVACGNGDDQRVGCGMGWWTEHAAHHGA